MRRWWAAALMVLVTADAAFARDTEAVAALKKRVVLEPEDEFKDPLDDPPDEVTIARIVGRLTLPDLASPLGTAGGETLERVAAGAYDHALDGYIQLLQNDDEPKLALTGEFDPLSSGLTSRDFHAVIHDRMRRLPPSTLDRYRMQIDADAARLLAEGAAQRDPAPLRKLLREAHVSSHADAAAALLGDLAFERGDFDQALLWWRRLTAPAATRPTIDRTRIRAKQVLALIFAGRPEATHEIERFRQLYPQARGSLAGREGLYHETLSHWFDRVRAAPNDGDPLDRGWPTFAGAGSRNRVVGKAPSPRLWLDGPAWRCALPHLEAKEPPPVWISATRSLAVPHSPIHPVIADGQVLISDGQSVRGFDLLTGKPRFRSPTPDFEAKHDGEPGPRAAFSVSTAPGRAFARLSRRLGDPQPRTLVCLDLHDSGKLLWLRGAADGHFDADPLVVGDSVVLSETVRDDTSSTRWLVSFNLDGTPQWRSKLAKIHDANDKTPRPGLLVDGGSVIVDATEAGAVVALDPATGRRLWAFRYPVLAAAASPRGHSSCLAADGRIYLAPADSPNIYCLDADTGRTLWERPWTKGPSDIIAAPPRVSEVIDLLGVVDDRLLFTDRFHLQALDAHTGATLAWQQPRLGKLPSHGRGLLAGSWIFWPTADPEVSWRAVTQLDGALRAHDSEPAYYEPTVLRGLPPGNVAFGQGCLVIAGPRELVVYAPAAEQLPQMQADPEAKSTPAKMYRLGSAFLDAGQSDRAKETFAALERRLPALDREPWTKLIRERTTPRQPAGPFAAKTVAKPTPVLAPAATPSFNKLTPAWGPIPGVAPPIERSHTTRPQDIAAVVEGDDIAFLNAVTGVEQFRRRRPSSPAAAEQPGCSNRGITWVGRANDIILIGTPDALEAFDIEARRPLWRFPAPALSEARWRLVDNVPEYLIDRPRLNGFRFTQNTVDFFEDRRRLIALDPQTGSLLNELWLDPVNALASEETPRYFDVDSSECEFVDPDEAHRRFSPLDDTTWAIGLSHGAVGVRQRGDFPGTTFQPARPMSLTGEPAHVFGDANFCFALIPRNHGSELIRFARPEARQALKTLWTISAFELRAGFDVSAARWDESALYFIHAGELQARSLADGSLLWKRALPNIPAPWKLERWGGGLIAWPQTHAGLPALSGPVDPFTAAWTLLHGRRGIGAVPIEFVDAKTGTLKQRLDIPHDRGPVFVNAARATLIFTAGGHVQAWTGAP